MANGPAVTRINELIQHNRNNPGLVQLLALTLADELDQRLDHVLVQLEEHFHPEEDVGP